MVRFPVLKPNYLPDGPAVRAHLANSQLAYLSQKRREGEEGRSRGGTWRRSRVDDRGQGLGW